MTLPLFFCNEQFTQGATFQLTGDEGRHAAAVKRIRVGEFVDVTNGQGDRATCETIAVKRDSLELVVRNVQQEVQGFPRIIVAQALAKGSRAELAIEILTETGVDVIIPWSATNSVVKWDDPTKAMTKWQRTILEATKQSRRAWLPELRPVHTTNELLGVIADVDVAVVLHEAADVSVSAVDVANAQSVLIVVGPEGGISENELVNFKQAGAHIVRMGSSVMRTSTAGGVAVGALLSRTNRWT